MEPLSMAHPGARPAQAGWDGWAGGNVLAHREQHTASAIGHQFRQIAHAAAGTRARAGSSLDACESVLVPTAPRRGRSRRWLPAYSRPILLSVGQPESIGSRA